MTTSQTTMSSLPDIDIEGPAVLKLLQDHGAEEKQCEEKKGTEKARKLITMEQFENSELTLV